MKKIIILLILLIGGYMWADNSSELILFDASKNAPDTFDCYTCKWVAGSNLKPVTNIVDFKGEKWLKFGYTGTQGECRASIEIKDQLKNLPPNKVPHGITFKIYYAGNDFKKIDVSITFPSETILVSTLTLKHGLHEYYFDKGWSRGKIPQDWRTMTTVFMTMTTGAPEFLLNKVSITLLKKKLIVKQLKILKSRKVAEVLPGKGAVSLTFDRQSPLKVKLGYDKNNLYVDTYAEYPNKPVANFHPGDKVGDVWGDELSEFFFDGWNDNQCFIQFVTNMNGAEWNLLKAYDETATMVISKEVNWRLKHKNKITFSPNVWKNELVIPLKALHVDLNRQFMGFQIAQNYQKHQNDIFKNIVWAPCKVYPLPSNFGLLVFNKKPFGLGKIEIVRAELSKGKSSTKANFIFSCQLDNFRAGQYTLRRYISTPDNSFIQLPKQAIDITASSNKKSINFPGQLSISGLYTFYIGLVNKAGDMRLAAVNIENSAPIIDKFGQRLFCPTPKKIKWGTGEFLAGKHNTISISQTASARTLLTAKLFKKALLDFTGKEYRIIRNGTKQGIILNLDKTIIPDSIKTRSRKDGYRLQVTPQVVTITGAGESGLYYGYKTFIQLLKQPMKRTVDSPVPAVDIVDYPDLPIRFVNLIHPWQFYQSAFKERHSIDYLINWVDRYIGSSKLNVLMVNIDSVVKYRRRPEFNADNCLYSLDDLAKLVKFCQDNFIEFIPRWQLGGHADWWLTIAHPELREKGYATQADVTKPNHNKIVFDCLLDVIEATKCKYINVGGDEWWHRLQNGEKPEKYLSNGKTRAEAFLEFFRTLSQFGKDHNVKLMMHEDMLNPFHNGTRYGLYKIIDRFPKDIILLPWNSEDNSINYFAQKGFKQWINPTGVLFPNKTISFIDGYGLTLYSFFNATTGRGPRDVPNYISYIFRSAEFAWNAKSDNRESIEYKINDGSMPALFNLYADPKNPYASTKINPIKLKSVYNCNFNELCRAELKGISVVNMPNGRKLVGNIPMQLQVENDNVVLISHNANFIVPVNGKYSSLIFLHSVLTNQKYIDENYRKLFWREWIYGRPVGDYYVIYSDGTKVKLPLRMDDNIGETIINPIFRLCGNCRYIMPIKLSNRNDLFLYQWEWVNPYPKKEIKSVQLTQTVIDFNLLLFAVSGREVAVPR
jgi:hypothetical protein